MEALNEGLFSSKEKIDHYKFTMGLKARFDMIRNVALPANIQNRQVKQILEEIAKIIKSLKWDSDINLKELKKGSYLIQFSKDEFYDLMLNLKTINDANWKKDDEQNIIENFLRRYDSVKFEIEETPIGLHVRNIFISNFFENRGLNIKIIRYFLEQYKFFFFKANNLEKDLNAWKELILMPDVYGMYLDNNYFWSFSKTKASYNNFFEKLNLYYSALLKEEDVVILSEYIKSYNPDVLKKNQNLIKSFEGTVVNLEILEILEKFKKKFQVLYLYFEAYKVYNNI